MPFDRIFNQPIIPSSHLGSANQLETRVRPFGWSASEKQRAARSLDLPRVAPHEKRWASHRVESVRVSFPRLFSLLCFASTHTD